MVDSNTTLIVVIILLLIILVKNKNNQNNNYYLISVSNNNNNYYNNYSDENYRLIFNVKPNNKYFIHLNKIYKVKINGEIELSNNNRINKILNHENIYDVKILNMNNDYYDDVIVLCESGVYYYKNMKNNGYEMYIVYLPQCFIDIINSDMSLSLSEIKAINLQNKNITEIKHTDINDDIKNIYLNNSIDNVFRKLEKLEKFYGKDSKKDINDELIINVCNSKSQEYYCKYFIFQDLNDKIINFILNATTAKHYTVLITENNENNIYNYDNDISGNPKSMHQQLIDSIKFEKVAKVSCEIMEPYSDSYSNNILHKNKSRNNKNEKNINFNFYSNLTDNSRFIGVIPYNHYINNVNTINIKIPNTTDKISSKIELHMLDGQKIILDNNNEIVSVNIGNAKIGKCLYITDLYGNTRTIVKPKSNILYKI